MANTQAIGVAYADQNISGADNLLATSAIGYTNAMNGVGGGGSVTQATSKSTGVTLNKACGQITMNNAALGAGAEAVFTVTNSTVTAYDVPVVAIASGGTSGSYVVSVAAVANGSFDIVISNVSAGSLSEAVVLNFAVINSVIS